MKCLALLPTVLGAALAFTNPATADLVFNLTSDHCTGGCGPQDDGFGNVTVADLGGGTLEFSTALLNNNTFIKTGFPLTFAFDLANSPTITYSNLTAGFSIPDATGLSQNAGNYHMDGTGFFDYGVLWGQQGGGHGFDGVLSFDITAIGLTLDSIATNLAGHQFAVDIYSGTTGLTGLVDASTVGVPGPVVGAGLPGLLSACGTLIFLARRRRTRRIA